MLDRRKFKAYASGKYIYLHIFIFVIGATNIKHIFLWKAARLKACNDEFYQLTLDSAERYAKLFKITNNFAELSVMGQQCNRSTENAVMDTADLKTVLAATNLALNSAQQSINILHGLQPVEKSGESLGDVNAEHQFKQPYEVRGWV